MEDAPLGSTLIRTERVYQEVPVERIVIDPTENYRWGSREAMERDLHMAGPGGAAYAAQRASIKDSGVQDPVGLVRRDDGYHVIYGFTRCVAAVEVGLRTVPAYVYGDDIPSYEIHCLQLRENSANLKRPASWIREVRMWRTLVDETTPVFEEVPAERRPKDEDGRPMTPRMAANESAARILGRSFKQYMDLEAQYQRLHPRVVELALEHGWVQQVCLEFLSGDTSAPYAGDFITATIAEVEKKEGLANATPGAVRCAKRRLLEAGRAAFVTGTKPTTRTALRRLEGDIRLSPGAVRDACVDCFSGIIAAHKLTPETAEKLRNSPVWYKVIGMGMASGAVSLPACASDSREPASRVDGAHHVNGERWVVVMLLTAFLRGYVQGVVGDVGAWMTGVDVIDGEKRQRRREFYGSVEAAVNSCAARTNTTILEMYRLAQSELRDRTRLTKPAAKGHP